MLTKEEQDYLSKIDPTRIAAVFPFNQDGKDLGKSIVEKIQQKIPDVEVLFMGSAALEIDGQKDIDIYVLRDSEEFERYLPTLKRLFGKPTKRGKYINKYFFEWKFKQEGYDIEIYLTEPPYRQIKVYEILKNNNNLLKQYEELKLSYNGKSYRDYQQAKYEFYNKILDEH